QGESAARSRRIRLLQCVTILGLILQPGALMPRLSPCRLTTIALISLVLFGAGRAAFAQAPPSGPPPQTSDEAKKAEPSWKISGLMFGDYFWVATDHRDAIEDQNGFWFRRIYLTYDQKFSES